MIRDVTLLTFFIGAKIDIWFFLNCLKQSRESNILGRFLSLYSKLRNYIQRTEALQLVSAPNASSHLVPYSAENGNDGELGKPLKIYSLKTRLRKERETLSEIQ